MNQHSNIQPKGEVELTIEWQNGKKETRVVQNTVLRRGREALAASLANDYGEIYQFYVNRMLFGDGGTSEGTPKYVNTERNGLFGTTLLVKPISRTIDPNFPNQVVFSSVITYEEANGETINEMALQMAIGDLYSMVTFGDISKTAAMQITWSWRISFI